MDIVLTSSVLIVFRETLEAHWDLEFMIQI